MDKTKTHFSISDLEILSGIKPHTIRTWEKRYDLFSPIRQSRNRRLYEIEDLKKILNISYLITQNYKISNLAKMPQANLNLEVEKVAFKNLNYQPVIKELVQDILEFDEPKINTTFNSLDQEYPFEFIYDKIISELLSYLEILWQTSSITSVHEHFIICIIRQKIQNKTSELVLVEKENNSIYVVFTPCQIVNDLDLLYLNYQIKSQNNKTIFLGQCVSVPILKSLFDKYPESDLLVYFSPKTNSEEITAIFDKYDKSEGFCNIKVHIINSSPLFSFTKCPATTIHKTTKAFVKKLTIVDEM